MKSIQSFLVLFLIVGLNSVGFSQSAMSLVVESKPANMLVVVSKSSSCKVCKENVVRVEKEFIDRIKDDTTRVIQNDLSDDETATNSSAILEKFNVSKSINPKNTGIIYFINLDAKKVISTISMTKSTEEIMDAYQLAQKS